MTAKTQKLPPLRIPPGLMVRKPIAPPPTVHMVPYKLLIIPKLVLKKDKPPALNTYKMKTSHIGDFMELRRLGKILFIDLKITPYGPFLSLDVESESENFVTIEFKNGYNLDQLRELMKNIINITGRTMVETINYADKYDGTIQEDLSDVSFELFN